MAEVTTQESASHFILSFVTVFLWPKTVQNYHESATYLWNYFLPFHSRVWQNNKSLSTLPPSKKKKGGKNGRVEAESLSVAYRRPHRHWTWWQHTSPTPCGYRRDNGHKPRGTLAAEWTGQSSTTAHTIPSSCRNDQTLDWQSSPPGWEKQKVIKIDFW